MEIYQFSQPSTEHLDRCEDAILTYDGHNSSPIRRAPIFAIIDGMGGHQHVDANDQLITGRDAAQLIRAVLIEDLEHLPPDIDAEIDGAAQTKITAAIKRAHQRVCQELNMGDSLLNLNRVGA